MRHSLLRSLCQRIAATLLAGAIGSTGWAAETIGQVIDVRGTVVVERGDQAMRLVNLSGLESGDIVRAQGDATASLMLSGKSVVYVIPYTELQISQSANGPAVNLIAGKSRTVTSQPLHFKAGALDLHVQRGAVLASNSSDIARAYVQDGAAQVQADGIQPVSLVQGQELRAQGQQIAGPFAADHAEWTLTRQMAQTQAPPPPLPPANSSPTPPMGGLGPAVPPMGRAANAPANPPQANQRSPQEEDIQRRRPPSTSQTQLAAGAFANSGTGFAATPGLSASAGIFADANQATLQGMNVLDNNNPFPGNIHVVTSETRYALNGVQLNAAETKKDFQNGDPAYYSIGVGPRPTTQVTTDLQTASKSKPESIAIPGFNAYVVKLDQYGTIDSTLDPDGALANNVGTAGFTGKTPTAPNITGATPLKDHRAQYNEKATFALGEIRTRPDGGRNHDSYEIAVRRSDQDRKIIKDPNGNDANDKVRPNTQIVPTTKNGHTEPAFKDVVDPRFLPAAPTVKVPNPGHFDPTGNGTRFSHLNQLRQAAVTTVLADQLYDTARRTGQTRFVIDGKVVDVSGYRR